jgi:hypothetical protein
MAIPRARRGTREREKEDASDGRSFLGFRSLRPLVTGRKLFGGGWNKKRGNQEVTLARETVYPIQDASDIDCALDWLEMDRWNVARQLLEGGELFADREKPREEIEVFLWKKEI